MNISLIFSDEEIEAIRGLTQNEEKEACDKLDLEPPAKTEGIQLTMGAYYPPYTETEVCKFLQVGSLKFWYIGTWLGRDVQSLSFLKSTA